MLTAYKIVAITFHIAVIVYFESRLLADQREQREAETLRRARLRALGFDAPAPRTNRIDW